MVTLVDVMRLRRLALSLIMAIGTASASQHSCKWSYKSLHWDLSPLIHQPSAIQDYQISRGAWMFDMNVCANTNTIPAVCQGPDRRPAPGYQTLVKDGERACYVMGNVNTGVWSLLDENKPEDGVKLTYSAGTKCDGRTGRSMEYHFICDPQVDGPGEPVTVAGECRFMIIWQTKFACPTYPAYSPLLAVWGLVLLGVYLVGGFVYNVCGRGEPISIGAVPHSEAIMALFLLCRECVPGPKGTSAQETTRLNPTADV
mmetsp:Transcript_12145/g.28622  ORF Transcript_12145/g.28622 Transcript_12145/m.28622 type:complete len:257 (-) Transcript_12145:81-851(-)